MPHAPNNPLLETHQRRAAETQAYDQIEIVSTFGEPQAEYAAIRKSVGLMDLPQRGFVELTGKDRHAFLNNLVSNQIYDKATKTGLTAGQVRYAFLLNLKGRVAMDLTLIEIGDRTYVEIDVRLAAIFASLLERYLFAEQVKITSVCDHLHEIVLHGPRAFEVLSRECEIESLDTGANVSVRLLDVDVVLWRDDLCGVPGVHIVLPASQAEIVWEHLIATHGQEIELGKRLLRPIGWAAFNTARIEAGRPLFGIDFELAEPSIPGAKVSTNEGVSNARPQGVLPAETGLLDRAVSFTKGCYLGQEVVARMHARQQVARKLVGIRMDDDALPMAGQPVFDAQQNTIGVLTSSTMSPSRSDAAIGLALIRKPHFDTGTILHVPAEGAVRTCRVTELPFI